jgi:hypothetical protein
MSFHADGFAGIGLQKTGCAQQADASLGHAVGRKLEGAKLARGVQNGPHNMTLSLNGQALNPDASLLGEIEMLAPESQIIEKVDSFFIALRNFAGACKTMRKQDGANSKSGDVLQS